MYAGTAWTATLTTPRVKDMVRFYLLSLESSLYIYQVILLRRFPLNWKHSILVYHFDTKSVVLSTNRCMIYRNRIEIGKNMCK